MFPNCFSAIYSVKIAGWKGTRQHSSTVQINESFYWKVHSWFHYWGFPHSISAIWKIRFCWSHLANVSRTSQGKSSSIQYGTTIFSSAGTKLNEVYFDRIASLCLHHDDKKGHRCCAVALYAGEFMDHKLYLIRQLTHRPRFYGTFCSLRFRSEFSKYYLGMGYLCLLITS